MGALELRNVVKHYPGERETVRAVDGVSLRVEPGEFVAVYGPSGSGKTTLLLVAAGMLPPDSGLVCFGGRDVSALDAKEGATFRRRELGFVYQAFHLNPGASALSNAAVKLVADGMSPNQARELARPWLDRVGLASRATHTPGRLSGGERQRVAIARALAGEPELVLADEPTGNLDTQRSKDVLGLLRDICRERQIPMVLVTHDPLGVDFADRVHTLTDGKLDEGVESGSTQPLTSP